MSYILSIESSGPLCSVSLHREGMLMEEISSDQPNAHAENLAVFIRDLMHNHSLNFNQLSAVAVSEGPGSYTGLRIGVSVAKGICYASDIPLISVDTLQSLALGILPFVHTPPEQTLLYPMVDARRMEVYTAGFDTGLTKLIPTAPVILDDGFFQSLNPGRHYFFAGNGAGKISTVTNLQNCTVLDEITFSSDRIGILAWQKWTMKQFADLAYFEPVYLKEFANILHKTGQS